METFACYAAGARCPGPTTHRTPSGSRIFFVYGPLLTNPAGGEIFCSAFVEMVATLWMVGHCCLATSTALLPVFAIIRMAVRKVSLASQLLGPGGPFLDLEMVVSRELFAPTFHSSHVDLMNWSRCDQSRRIDCAGSWAVRAAHKVGGSECGVTTADRRFLHAAVDRQALANTQSHSNYSRGEQ